MSRWPREDDFDPVIKAAIDSFSWVGLNKDAVFAFVKAIVAKESGFNPAATRAEAANNASIGLMQVLYTTAQGLGYPGPMGDPKNLTGLYAPGTNVFLGVKLINQLLQRLGSNLMAVASAYNGGVRPQLGFGARLTKDTRLCLARDASGNCTRWYDARAGEFGNQPYVDAVMHDYDYFFRSAPSLDQPILQPAPAAFAVGESGVSGLEVGAWALLALGVLGYLIVRSR